MKTSLATRAGPCHRNPFVLLATALVALLFAGPGLARAAGSASPRSRTAAPRSQLLPVWVYINGAVPVVGGDVRIATGNGSVGQVSGRVSSRTNAQGVVMLVFARVPRHFTVIVRGGQAGGQRLIGSQRAEINGYRGHDSVIEVNPLTTVVARLRHERPGLTYRGATLIVKRYFRVPTWANLAWNLRTSRGWFDARAYLRQARRYGSVDRLTRVVVWRMLHGQVRMPRVAATVRVGTAEATARAAGLGSSAAQLVGNVFKQLLGTAVEIQKQELAGGALGGLLQLAQTLGLAHTSPSELDRVREQLNGLSTQITQLQGQVQDVSKRLERINAGHLLAQSNGIIGDISDAYERMAILANMSPTDDTREGFAADLTAQIGTDLKTAPATLDLQLSPKLGIGDDVFKAASRSLAVSSRFFDERQSQEVAAVYEYFATYQAQLAILLTNYYNAHPRSHSPQTINKLISPIQTNITKQATSLKPPVPAGAFFDTRTPKFMWSMYPQTLTALTLLEQHTQTSTTLTNGTFGNYQLPSSHDLRNLVDGSTGDPRAWLQAQIKVNLPHQLLWVSDPFEEFTSRFQCRINISIFDLLTVKLEQWSYHDTRPGITGPCSPTASKLGEVDLNDSRIRDFLRSKYGGALLLRYLAPGESYWW